MANYSIAFRDYGNELTTTTVQLPTINAGNFAANMTAIQALGVAIGALVIGATDHSQIHLDKVGGNATPPSDVNAQRERKWLVRYRDTVTGKAYNIEIGTAKLSGLLKPNSDQADLTQTGWTDFITAFEAIAVSPEGNAVEVIEAFHVGRST